MPAARAASSREDPSSTSARASIRRAARASRHRPASRRSSPAPSSFRVTATVMAPLRRSATPPINALGPRVAPRAQRSEAGAVGIRLFRVDPVEGGSIGLACRAAAELGLPEPQAGQLAPSAAVLPRRPEVAVLEGRSLRPPLQVLPVRDADEPASPLRQRRAVEYGR